MIERISGGDSVTAAKLNEVADALETVYSVIISDYVNHATATLFAFTGQDGERDVDRESRLTFVHKHRYLYYTLNDSDDPAEIIDPSGLNDNVQLTDVEPEEVGEFDLSGVEWLTVGMMYHVRYVVWALEVQRGDYII